MPKKIDKMPYLHGLDVNFDQQARLNRQERISREILELWRLKNSSVDMCGVFFPEPHDFRDQQLLIRVLPS